MNTKTMQTVKIGVMPYVYKYICKTYGPGDRFDLTHSSRSDLFLSFEHLALTARIIPQPVRLPGRWIHLKIGDIPALVQSYNINQQWLRAGAFFQHEFMLHLRQYIEAQRDIALQFGLKENEWNARIGLESFLARYDILEHEYSYESLRRQWTRQNAPENSPLYQKLWKDIGFGGSDNQHFKPCKISLGVQNEIYFHCLSRSRQDIVKKHIRIPRRLMDSGEWIEWTYDATQIINNLLRKGYTIK